MTTGHHLTHRSLTWTLGAAAAVAAAVALVAAAGVPPAGAQDGSDAPVVEPARQLTSDQNPSRLYNIPRMAVNPNDTSTIAVLTADNRNGGCGVAVSQDSGLSWTRSESWMPSDQSFCIQRNQGQATALQFAPNGSLYMGMSASSATTTPPHPQGPVDAMFARSPDLGQTHDTFMVAESGTPDDYEFDGETHAVIEQRKDAGMAIDPDNSDVVYRSWGYGVRGQDQGPVPGWGLGCPDNCAPELAQVSVSTDGGESWSDPINLLEEVDIDANSVSYPHMVTGPDGTVHGFAQGSTGEDGPSPLFMFTSSDQGETWQAQQIFEGVAEYGAPQPAVNPNTGDLYLAFMSRGDSEENPQEIMFMSSSDGGETWTEPTDVSDDADDAPHNQYMPGIDVAPNGRIDIGWYDYRNDPFFTGGEAGTMNTTVGEQYWDVYYTYSTDGGDSWAPNLRVSDRLVNGDIGSSFSNQDTRGPMAVGSTDYAAMFAWPDSRAGGPESDVEDIYFTRVRHDGVTAAAAASGVEAGGLPGWGWGILGAAIGLVLAGLVLVTTVRSTRSPSRQKATATQES